jgi:hypothetical protein
MATSSTLLYEYGTIDTACVSRLASSSSGYDSKSLGLINGSASRCAICSASCECSVESSTHTDVDVAKELERKLLVVNLDSQQRAPLVVDAVSCCSGEASSIAKAIQTNQRNIVDCPACDEYRYPYPNTRGYQYPHTRRYKKEKSHAKDLGVISGFHGYSTEIALLRTLCLCIVGELDVVSLFPG